MWRKVWLKCLEIHFGVNLRNIVHVLVDTLPSDKTPDGSDYLAPRYIKSGFLWGAKFCKAKWWVTCAVPDQNQKPRKYTPKNSWMAPKNRPIERKVVFQPSIFRCYANFRGSKHFLLGKIVVFAFINPTPPLFSKKPLPPLTVSNKMKNNQGVEFSSQKVGVQTSTVSVSYPPGN